MADTASLVRTLAQHDAHTDPCRGDLGKAQASLLDAVSRQVAAVPSEVVTEALAVVAAIDRMTRKWRITSP